MKKMVAIILAVAMCAAMLALPVSAVEQDENVHSSGAGVLTETGNDLLPELDEDLLSILTDIEALVEKYGPEIPEEVKNGTDKGTTSVYKPNEKSHYVAFGDDTAYDKGSYVSVLAERYGISSKNLAKKNMMIDEVDAAYLAANAAEIKKADLISIGFFIVSNRFINTVCIEIKTSRQSHFFQYGNDSFTNLTATHRNHAECDTFAVIQSVKLFITFDAVSDCMPEIKYTSESGFFFILFHNHFLDLKGAFDDRIKVFRHILRFNETEKLRVKGCCHFDGFGKSVCDLSFGKRFQHVRVDKNSFRLMECTDDIFHTAQIDGSLTSDGGIHFGKKGRGNIIKINASHKRCRSKA